MARATSKAEAAVMSTRAMGPGHGWSWLARAVNLGRGNPKAVPPLEVLFQFIPEEDIDVIDYLQRSPDSQRLKRSVGLRFSIECSAFVRGL